MRERERTPQPRQAPAARPALSDFTVSGKLLNMGPATAYHVVLSVGGQEIALGVIAPGDGADWSAEFKSRRSAPGPSGVRYTSELGISKSARL